MSSTLTSNELTSYCRQTAQNAKEASYQLTSLDTQMKNQWLEDSAEALVDAVDLIIQANAKDLEAAAGYGLSDAAVDRLRLDRIAHRRDRRCTSRNRNVARPHRRSDRWVYASGRTADFEKTCVRWVWFSLSTKAVRT